MTFCKIPTEKTFLAAGRNVSLSRNFAVGILLFCGWIGAAGGQTSALPLEVRTTILPKASLQKPYQARLEAAGGVAPLKWELTAGSLPDGLTLGGDGVISGVPGKAGEFRFTVTVRDSGKPQYQRQRQLSLVVESPLFAEWGRPPKVAGQRLEGSILVSNHTEHDFDLTVIVLAVNDTGRATAIGYQHFTLKKNSDQVEIPFGDNLPKGSYQLNVDAVAETPATGSIYRQRLVPKERFEVRTGP
jgi:hypothetical protein